MAKKTSTNYFEKLEGEVQSNQSKVSLVLGALIVLVVGILVFNYFNKNKADLGPAQQTEVSQEEDVAPDKLPGKYTVKEGDTLFTIAEKYYSDGFQYSEIARANDLKNPDLLETGQIIEIPKLESQIAQVPETQATPQPSASAEPKQEQSLGTGGGDTTIWGPKIDGNTYTVTEGDWLSTIAARAYGDIMAFDRIVKENNISNPDLIEPGLVLKLPR